MSNGVPNRIAEARKANGWSQAELASQLGVSQQAVQRWESGARDIRAGRLADLSRVLGVTVSYLLGFDSIDYVIERDVQSASSLVSGDSGHLLGVWSQLNPEMRGTLSTIADALLQAQRDLCGDE